MRKETLSRRLAPLVALPMTLVALAPPLAAQTGSVVKEEVEIREVGVVVELESSLRGLPSAELGRRIAVLENGVSRSPMSVAELASPGEPPYSRVVVAFDTGHCKEEILRAGAAAVGSAADQLATLGPVDVVRAGERSETVLAGADSAGPIAKVTAAIARAERCAPDAESASVVPPGLDPGACASKPCLLVWVGGGWGDDPAAVDAQSAELDRRVETLASGGWVVLSAPIATSEKPKEGPSIRPPENQPGTDRYTFGVSIFGSKKREKLTAEEYAEAVDLWLAPLRRLAVGTAGEIVTTGEQLGDALRSLGRRSILWYRAERAVGAPPPKLEVHEVGGNGRKFKAPEWAPSLSK